MEPTYDEIKSGYDEENHSQEKDILRVIKRLKAAEDQLYILTVEGYWEEVPSYIQLDREVKELIMKLDDVITDILEDFE
jgi:hypothetical protein